MLWSARHIPNVISSLRILLVVPIAIALGHHRLELTIGLFFVAAISDVADGFLAKRFGWQSALGGVLDPAADKLLLVTVFVTLFYLKLVPLWLMVAAVTRDVIIVCGAVAFRYRVGAVAARPSAISKMNTVCQALFILAVVGGAEFATPPSWVVVTLGALVFVTVVISGIDYVAVYGQLAWRVRDVRS